MEVRRETYIVDGIEEVLGELLEGLLLILGFGGDDCVKIITKIRSLGTEIVHNIRPSFLVDQ